MCILWLETYARIHWYGVSKDHFVEGIRRLHRKLKRLTAEAHMIVLCTKHRTVPNVDGLSTTHCSFLRQYAVKLKSLCRLWLFLLSPGECLTLYEFSMYYPLLLISVF